MFLIFVIGPLFGVFYLENLMFMLGKFWIVQNLDLSGPNMAQNVVFRLFLPNATMNVPNFRYRNLFWCLLLGKPIVYARKILDWPKFALFVVIWQNYIYHSFCFFDLLLLYFLYLVSFVLDARDHGAYSLLL